MSVEDGETGAPWTDHEAEAAAEVYFTMLRMQEAGQSFNKAEHNRRLAELLPARSRGSIEFKHCNISAVLIQLGIQPLTGYRPRYNYQEKLVDIIGRALSSDRRLDEFAARSVELPAETPLMEDFSDFVVATPQIKHSIAEQCSWRFSSPVQRDYLAREARNRSLGLAGELLVMEYEAHRLDDAGKKHLANRIEHVSQSRGDGTGYDILSFDLDGRERFIEVKTTAYMAETPFFISPNEVEFSEAQSEQFHLYRLFGFRTKPQMFRLAGSVPAHCKLDTASYRATLIAR